MTEEQFPAKFNVFDPPKKPAPAPTPVADEIAAIAAAYEALASIDYPAQQRAMKWLRGKLGV